MGYTSDLVVGLAEMLTLNNLGVYRTSPPYTATETGIVLSSMPDAPDFAICLTEYPVDDDVTTDTVTGVQIRMRAGADPVALMDLRDGVRELLHNRRGYWLRGVFVAVSWRQSEALLGQDAHGRDDRTSNFYFRTTRPSPHTYE